jgi:hypothetical protein
MLSCSKWSIFDMTAEQQSDQRSGPERDRVKDLPSPTAPSPQPGPPHLNDRPEALRSSHC